MADKKISALTAMTAPATADFLHIIDDNSGTYTNQKITLANLFDAIPGYIGFATTQAREYELAKGSFRSYEHAKESRLCDGKNTKAKRNDR